MEFSRQMIKQRLAELRHQYPKVVPGVILHARWKGSRKPYMVQVLEYPRYLRQVDIEPLDMTAVRQKLAEYFWQPKVALSEAGVNSEAIMIGLSRQLASDELYNPTFEVVKRVQLGQEIIRKVFVTPSGRFMLDPAEGKFTPCVSVVFVRGAGRGQMEIVDPACLYESYEQAVAVAPLREVREGVPAVRTPVMRK